MKYEDVIRYAGQPVCVQLAGNVNMVDAHERVEGDERIAEVQILSQAFKDPRTGQTTQPMPIVTSVLPAALITKVEGSNEAVAIEYMAPSSARIEIAIDAGLIIAIMRIKSKSKGKGAEPNLI